MTMKKTLLAFVALSFLGSFLAASAGAQALMPAPRKMPREPVARENLAGSREAAPPARQVEGPAAIIDGEKLRIADTDLRLFGIVPPQLSASYGPQARAALDMLAGGQSVTCQIRDRDRDGRLLATCRNASGLDMAMELLKRGLAVTARGSIAETELAAPYASAEQAAQNQKIGLWSVAMLSSAVPIPAPAAAPAPQAKQESVPANDNKEEKPAPKSEKPSADTQTQAKIAADLLAQQTQSKLDDNAWVSREDKGFFERYQILIAGFLMLATACGIMGALWAQKNRDRCEEIKATAAALRGELMAARSVCLGRARSITSEDEDKAATWPRLRATLYQAYVGRLGLLGAELARQVASIYGQAGDYAALYHAPNESPKKQALEILAKRIEDVLPKLAEIERSGHLSHRWMYYSPMTQSAPTPSMPAYEATPQAYVTPTASASVSKTNMATAAMRNTIALWESVRSFIQNHKDAPVAHHEALPEPNDPHSAEYAAMIEADMARYQQYGENIETLDITPQKKRG